MTGVSRKVLLGLLLAAFAGAACADVGALGRLFFTPQERAEFDRQRQARLEGRAKSPDEASTYTVNGIIRRGDGRQITWINGGLVEEISALPRAAPGLKAGETIVTGSGERSDILGAGRIIVNPANNQRGR